MKVLRPPFAYYGGKTRMAKDIVKLIPKDANTYIEPFAGSLAVLLAKEPHKVEVVNDLDDRLVAFWRVLRDKPEELQRALSLTPYARSEFEDALSGIDDQCDDVEFARRVFVILRQSRKRVTHTTKGNFRPKGGPPGHPGNAFVNSVDALLDVSARLRSVVVESMDALELFHAWDGEGVVMYLDPPYVGETRTDRNYRVENAGLEFHESLVGVLLSCSSRVILSGYDHPVYDPLRSWRRVDSMRRTGSTFAGSRYAAETLWVNFDLPGGGN